MDLQLSPERRAFAEQVAAWLGEAVPERPLPPVATAEGLAAHRAWEERLRTGGYGALRWPREFGGGGRDAIDDWIFQDAYIRAGAPERLNRLGLGLAGPAIMEFGSPEQRRRWLPGILACTQLWCQGFSEPGAGSDLAAVATRAVREGDAYRVTGQKLWTSLASWADWMFALVRTDPDAPRHAGLTFLMIRMDAPGVQVRPLHQLHGAQGFAEVFLDGVEAPVDDVLGAEGQGWRIATATLGYERGGGIAHSTRFLREVDELVRLAELTGMARDPLVRDAVAARYAEAVAFRRFEQHQLTRREPVGTAETSLAKLTWSEMEARIFETALDLLGPLAEVAGEPAESAMAADLHRGYWHARASRIFAGTSEIQRNVIAERLLGLPREPVAKGERWTST